MAKLPLDKQASILPAGFPQYIRSECAWTGADIENDPTPEHFILTLSEGQIAELEQACSEFQGKRSPYIVWRRADNVATGLGLPLDNISQETFPLPTLGGSLKVLAKVLTNGVGFFRIRGLDTSWYSSETNVIIYIGISSYIGAKRGRQDEYGNMLRKCRLRSVMGS